MRYSAWLDPARRGFVAYRRRDWAERAARLRRRRGFRARVFRVFVGGCCA